MPKTAVQIKVWIESKGKVWTFRILIIGGILISALSELGYYSVSVRILIILIYSSLLILLEIFISEISTVQDISQEGVMLDWNAAVPLIRKDADKAKHLTIIARSGETFYYALRDILLSRHDIQLTLVLTQTHMDQQEFAQYQKGWIERWGQLSAEMAGSVTVHQATVSFELQCIIMDGNIGYLGYRKEAVGTRALLENHIRVTNLSSHGRFLIDFYSSWVTAHAGPIP